MDISDIAKDYKISKVTAYRYLKWTPAAKENKANINDVSREEEMKKVLQVTRPEDF